MKKPYVMVAVPSMGNIHVLLVRRLLELMANRHVQLTLFLPYPPLVPHDTARNYLMKKFLESPCTHLLQIDADVIPPENILDLLDNKVDVVSAICHVFNGDELVTTASREREIDGKAVSPKGVTFSKEEDLVPVDYFGGGCVLLTKKVALALQAAKIPGYAFDYDADGISWRGEDYHFCKVMRDLGFQPYVDKRIKCQHFKSVDLLWLNKLLYRYYTAGKHLPPEQHGNGNLHGAATLDQDAGAARGAA